MKETLTKTFFKQPTLTVARELLGKYLVRRCPSAGSGRRRRRVVAAMITEVEAYDGPHDRASHASRGLTKRNAPMFGPAGRWYVYFTYGMHWMLNIVTREKGYPAAVLIRGVALNTNGHESGHEWTQMIHGPARVTKFFKVGKSFNNKKAVPKNGLWIEDRGVKIGKRQMVKGARIGVDYAGSVWAKKRWNFKVKIKTARL